MSGGTIKWRRYDVPPDPPSPQLYWSEDPLGRRLHFYKDGKHCVIPMNDLVEMDMDYDSENALGVGVIGGSHTQSMAGCIPGVWGQQQMAPSPYAKLNDIDLERQVFAMLNQASQQQQAVSNSVGGPAQVPIEQLIILEDCPL